MCELGRVSKAHFLVEKGKEKDREWMRMLATPPGEKVEQKRVRAGAK